MTTKRAVGILVGSIVACTCLILLGLVYRCRKHRKQKIRRAGTVPYIVNPQCTIAAGSLALPSPPPPEYVHADRASRSFRNDAASARPTMHIAGLHDRANVTTEFSSPSPSGKPDAPTKQLDDRDQTLVP